MRKVLFLVLVVALLLFNVAVPQAATTYDGAWTDTDGDANLFSTNIFTGGNAPYALYIYDWGNTATSLEVLPEGGTASTVYFGQDNLGDWFAGLTDIRDGVDSSDTGLLELGQSPLFGFYFLNSQDNKELSYSLVELQPGKSYSITPDLAGAVSVLVSDAQPIPLPGAFWLLGSGVLGVVALGRKRLSG